MLNKIKSSITKKIKNKAILWISLWILANVWVILWWVNNAKADFLYEIKSWDNLTRISKMFNVKINDILTSNPYIKDKNIIFPWKFINIPEKENNKIKELKPKKYKEKKIVKKNEKEKIKQSEKIISTTHKKRPEWYSEKGNPNQVFTPEIKDEIIKSKRLFSPFFEYWNTYHSKKMKKIISKNISKKKKKNEVVWLFLNDNEIYGKRYAIKKIQEMFFGAKITNKYNKIFSKSWYKITPNQILELYSKTETSWWNYYDYFIQAKNEKDPKKRKQLLIKATKRAIWSAWEVWTYQITADWLYDTDNHWLDIKGNLEKNTKKLRIDVYNIFLKSIDDNLDEDTLNKRLTKFDLRFSHNIWNVVVASFYKMYNKYNTPWLSEDVKIKLCFTAFNRWIWYANDVHKLLQINYSDWAKLLDTTDINKRMCFLKLASLENHFKWISSV